MTRTYATPGTKLLTLVVTVSALILVPTAAAADFSITSVEPVGESVAGEDTTFRVNIENTGSGTLQFTDESGLKLSVDGEPVNEVDFLTETVYRGSDRYLSVQPGETATWSVGAVIRETGRHNVQVETTGSYSYGGEARGEAVSTSGEVEVSNPAVEDFQFYVLKSSTGIKPSIVLGPGDAYTGEVDVEISRGGETTYSGNFSLQGDNSLAPVIEREQFFSGEGDYTLVASFQGSSGSQGFSYSAESPGGSVSGSSPAEGSEGTATETAVATETPETAETETATETPAGTGSPEPDATSSPRDEGEEASSPGFTAAAILVAIAAAAKVGGKD